MPPPRPTHRPSRIRPTAATVKPLHRERTPISAICGGGTHPAQTPQLGRDRPAPPNTMKTSCAVSIPPVGRVRRRGWCVDQPRILHEDHEGRASHEATRRVIRRTGSRPATPTRPEAITAGSLRGLRVLRDLRAKADQRPLQPPSRTHLPTSMKTPCAVRIPRMVSQPHDPAVADDQSPAEHHAAKTPCAVSTANHGTGRDVQSGRIAQAASQTQRRLLPRGPHTP